MKIQGKPKLEASGKMKDVLELIHDYNRILQMLRVVEYDKLLNDLRERLAKVYEVRLQALLRGDDPHGVECEELDKIFDAAGYESFDLRAEIQKELAEIQERAEANSIRRRELRQYYRQVGR